MKPIENIFTQFPQQISKPPNPATPIIIDTREKQSFIAANLIERNANIKFEHLQVADYLIADIAIERKTFSDFVNSMLNKRLHQQLWNLKKYPQHIVIIEGFDYRYHETRIHENAVRGMLLSIITDFHVPIIFTEDEQDTANFLILLAKKQDKPKTTTSLRPSKSLPSLTQQKQFILEGFPGIGPTIAKQLLENFKTLKNIFNASEEQLSKINKFNKNKIEKFKQILQS